jgi:hypothetical protein
MKKPSLIENVCRCYADGLAAGLSDSPKSHPWRIEFRGVTEYEQAYQLGIKDGRVMRERKLREALEPQADGQSARSEFGTSMTALGMSALKYLNL